MNDTDDDAATSDLPDSDTVNVQYLEMCRRLGVEPTTHERERERDAQIDAGGVRLVDQRAVADARRRVRLP